MAKSFEVKLNEALEQLKAASATKYAKICAVLPTLLPPCDVAVQLKCVEEALAEQVRESARNPLGLENIEEAKQEFAILFGLEPGKEVIKENVTRHIPKNNGAEGNQPITEVDRITAKITAKKEALVESVKGRFNGNEAGARAFLKLPAKDPQGLTTKQAFDYRFARAIGLSESDAMVVAKLTPIKEVNNNPRY